MRSSSLQWIILSVAFFLAVMPPFASPTRTQAVDTLLAKLVLRERREIGLSDTEDHLGSYHTLGESTNHHSSHTTSNNRNEHRNRAKVHKYGSHEKSSSFGASATLHAQYLALSSLSDSQRAQDGHPSKEGSNPAPEFVFVQPIVTVKATKLATLPCSVKNLGDRQVVWRRISTNEFLTIGKLVWSKDPRVLVDFHQLEGGVSSWNLLVKAVDHSDAGMYECQVTSSEPAVMNVDLQVQEITTTAAPPKRVLKKVTQRAFVHTEMKAADQQRREAPPRRQTLTAGQSIRLKCKKSTDWLGGPRAGIQWYKDGELVNSDQRVMLTRYELEADRMYVSDLIIDRSRLADSGEYECRSKSEVLHAAMIFVLPNTTIGSETASSNREDRQSKFYIGSLKTENGASSPKGVFQGSSAFLLVYIFPLLISFIMSRLFVHFTIFSSFSPKEGIIKLVDQT